MFSNGAVLSMLMPDCVSDAVLPARSAQVPVADMLVPSLSTVVLTGVATTPERSSPQLQLTVTLLLFQPLPLASVRFEKVITGEVLSIFTAGEVNIWLFPALSVTVTSPVTAGPSAVSTRGLLAGLVVSTPERLSPVVNENETLVLFQPLPLAAGLAFPKTSVGSAVSMLMPLCVSLAVLSARSWQVPVALWLAPSLLTVSLTVAALGPERLSAQLQLSVTSPLFQPLLLAAVRLTNAIVGAVLSILMPVC